MDMQQLQKLGPLAEREPARIAKRLAVGGFHGHVSNRFFG
jgi:hypothetical protein